MNCPVLDRRFARRFFAAAQHDDGWWRIPSFTLFPGFRDAAAQLGRLPGGTVRAFEMLTRRCPGQFRIARAHGLEEPEMAFVLVSGDIRQRQLDPDALDVIR